MVAKNQFGQIVGMPVKNWQGAKRPLKLIMQGKYCTLEPLNDQKHSNELFNILTSEESWTYLPYGPFSTIGQFQNHLQKLISRDNTLLYAILDPKTGQAIGIAGYLNINSEHGTIEVGHLHFSKLLKKTRAATEAMYLMMQRAFEELIYRRYEWKCNFTQPKLN